MLVPFDFTGIVSRGLSALDAGPGIFSEQRGFASRSIAVDRLSHAALFARDNKVPGVGLTDGYRHWGNAGRILLRETKGQYRRLIDQLGGVVYQG